MPETKEAGDAALLLELEPVIDAAVNARAITIANAVRDDAIAGVHDVVSTYRSVAVYFDPLITDVDAVRSSLDRAASLPAAPTHGRTIEIPVEYGNDAGPDLASVAAFAGIDERAVVAVHTARDYRVFMLGFLPGFAYLGSVDATIAAPRRPSPRPGVHAGSVGIAGSQTGVYPCDAPGGWQIIGRTSTRMFDLDRSPQALLAPGDVVRFVAKPREVVEGGGRPSGRSGSAGSLQDGTASHATEIARSITVIDPGLHTSIQDLGRRGYQVSGVPVSGAMDRVGHRTANALVGNDAGEATLEATLVGPHLRVEQATRLAIAGGDLGATLGGVAVPHATPVACPPGALLRFERRVHGARAYIAFDGGIHVRPVLGSRSTHVLSGMGGLGGRALIRGDRVALGPATNRMSARAKEPADPARHVLTGGARLRVMPGPQSDCFPPEAIDVLQQARFTVSAQSNRMGYRLQGASVPRLADREMISDAVFTGAVQVPASGEPILLMADRQTTGGYPQIAVVITADLPMAAQLAPGDWVEFQVCSRSDALAALAAQEAALRDVD